MPCNDHSRELLNALIDGELVPAKKDHVEQHLAQCEECMRERDALLALRALLNQHAPYHLAPSGFPQRIQSASATRNVIPQHKPLRRWYIAAAAALAIVVSLWHVYSELRKAHPEILAREHAASIERELVARHRQSISAGPLVDFNSSNPDRIQQFFAGKIDYHFKVPDLSRNGFELAGGRVEILEHQPVASIVYRHDQRIISFFLWPVKKRYYQNESNTKSGPFQVAYWSARGMHCWLVSDLSPPESLALGNLLEKSLQSPAS